MRKVTFIINPVSGVFKKGKISGLIDLYLDKSKFEYEILREINRATQKTQDGKKITTLISDYLIEQHLLILRESHVLK